MMRIRGTEAVLSAEMTASFESFIRSGVVNYSEISGLSHGDEVDIAVDESGEVVLRGIVEGLSSTYSGTDIAHSVLVSSRTAILLRADSSHLAGSWTNTPAQAIITQLCNEFKVTVDWRAPAIKVDKFRIRKSQAEIVADAIDRLCQAHGLMVSVSASGALVVSDSKAVPSEVDIVLPLSVTHRVDHSGLNSTIKAISGFRTHTQPCPIPTVYAPGSFAAQSRVSQDKLVEAAIRKMAKMVSASDTISFRTSGFGYIEPGSMTFVTDDRLGIRNRYRVESCTLMFNTGTVETAIDLGLVA